MRICVIGNAQSVHVQRWSRAYADRGHDVHVLSVRPRPIERVRVHAMLAAPSPWKVALGYAALASRARRLLRTLGPDVVHAHYSVTHGAIAALAGFRPRVVTVWGTDVIWRGAGSMPLHRRALNRLALSSPSVVTSASRFMTEHARDFTGTGVEVVVVPFGVDPELFSPAAREPGDGFRVGLVKTLSERYGPHVLLDAARAAAEGIPDLRLVLAGAGPMLDELRRMADAPPLRGKVEFPGFVEHARVPALMRTLDVFVNPSIVRESFGVSVLEASATGIPVIATRVGGVPEVCRDQETGLLVPADDPAALAEALLHLHRDPATRAAMGAAGRRMVVSEFGWDRSVDRMLEILAALVATPARPPC